MTNKQTINKNIKTVFDFVREIIDDPELAEQLPDKFDMDDQKKLIDSIRKSRRVKKIKQKPTLQK